MEKNLPIDHLSYSSFMQLLRNPLIFKLKHILNIYNSKSGVSAMVGISGHKALQFYYGGAENVEIPTDLVERRAKAIEYGMSHITGTSDDFIDYGKKGKREDILKRYTNAMRFYWAEEPEYHKVLACEAKLSAEMKTLDGDLLPLPGSGKPDLVVENAKGEVEIIDTKFVSSFTNYDTEDWNKIIQAMFMFHLIRGSMDLTATRMIFREIKTSENSKDQTGQPQIRDWVVPFDHKPYFIMFYNLYKDVVRFLANDPIFLPNLGDMYDGEHAGLMYAQGLIDADMSDVEVMHKVKDVMLVSKKFVMSNLDRVENTNLPLQEKIKMRLAEFGLPVEPVDAIEGAQLIQYRFKVSAGVRMSTIQKHKADIERTVASKGYVRIVTPIPGTEYLGIEVENENRKTIELTKEHLEQNTMLIPVGMAVDGSLIRIDLLEAPHLLIAGATGSGKSVMINTVLEALTQQMSAADMRLILIDPKRVELSAFKNKPHLGDKKIIYETAGAINELTALLEEMDRRYITLERAGKRDLATYNATRKSEKTKLPYIVCVVDEFADLILQGRSTKRKKIEGEGIDGNVEYLVSRIAQIGRAAGIHMVIATQRPSVDVITGLIKANFPTRIAFRTSSPVDSTVILGEPGAEKLSGKGDMLLMGPMIAGGKVRLQGLYA